MPVVLAMFAGTQEPQRGEIVLAGHRDSVTDLAFSADGQLLVTSSVDLDVKIWNSRSGQEIASILAGERYPENNAPALQFFVNAVAFTPDCKSLVTLGYSIRRWSIDGGVKEFELTTDRCADCFALSPDGSLLAVAAGDLCLRDGWTGALSRQLLRPGIARVRQMAFLGNGDFLLSGGEHKDKRDDAHLVVWEIKSGTPAYDLGKGYLGVDRITVSPDRATIAASLRESIGGRMKTVLKVWTLPDMKELFTTDLVRTPRALVLSRNGDLLVGLDDDGTVVGWRLRGGLDNRLVIPPRSGVCSAIVAPDCKFIALSSTKKLSGDSDEAIVELWDPDARVKLLERRLNTKPLRPAIQEWCPNNVMLTLSFDGKRLAAGLQSGQVVLLNLESLLREK